VTVENGHGGYVTNLSADSFSVFEDGKPQTIAFFNRQDAPVTVGLLVDRSGSMRTVRELVATAAASFAAHSNPQDEILRAPRSGDDVRAALPVRSRLQTMGPTLRRALFDEFDRAGDGPRCTTRSRRDWCMPTPARTNAKCW
jgi:hypothetical protein